MTKIFDFGGGDADGVGFKTFNPESDSRELLDPRPLGLGGVRQELLVDGSWWLL